MINRREFAQATAIALAVAVIPTVGTKQGLVLEFANREVMVARFFGRLPGVVDRIAEQKGLSVLKREGQTQFFPVYDSAGRMKDCLWAILYDPNDQRPDKGVWDYPIRRVSAEELT